MGYLSSEGLLMSCVEDSMDITCTTDLRRPVSSTGLSLLSEDWGRVSEVVDLSPVPLMYM